MGILIAPFRPEGALQCIQLYERVLGVRTREHRSLVRSKTKEPRHERPQLCELIVFLELQNEYKSRAVPSFYMQWNKRRSPSLLINLDVSQFENKNLNI